jgi:amino-acid N-acetyltransferase
MNNSKKAESIRDVIRYLKKFMGALVVIYLDDKTISSPLFPLHMRDIALLHQAGLKVVIIPGARQRIDQVLSNEGIEWSYKNNIRVTNEDAMPLVKMAAFDVSNTVMTNLAANGITAVIGNWVRSRAKGVVDGFDFGTAGEIDRLDTQSLNVVLSDGFIPISHALAGALQDDLIIFLPCFWPSRLRLHSRPTSSFFLWEKMLPFKRTDRLFLQ